MAGIIGKPRKFEAMPHPPCSGRPCAACGKDAQSCCMECVLSFCSDCIVDHNEDSMNEDHCVVEIGDHMMCDSHPASVVTIHCMSCSQSMCSVCSMKHDRSHVREKIERSKMQRKVLRENSDLLSKSLQVIEEKQHAVAMLRKLHESIHEEIRENLNDFVTKLITKLENLRDASMTEIEQIVGASMRAIDEEIRIEEASEKVQSLLSEMEGSIDGKPQECLKSFAELSGRYERIQAEGIEEREVPLIADVEEGLAKNVDLEVDNFCQDLQRILAQVDYESTRSALIQPRYS